MKRRPRSSEPPRIEPLPVQPLYRASLLARAIGVNHRQFQRLLELEGVHVFRIGRFVFVPLTELEEKVPPLWESIKAAESLRRALEDV